MASWNSQQRASQRGSQSYAAHVRQLNFQHACTQAYEAGKRAGLHEATTPSFTLLKNLESVRSCKKFSKSRKKVHAGAKVYWWEQRNSPLAKAVAAQAMQAQKGELTNA